MSERKIILSSPMSNERLRGITDWRRDPLIPEVTDSVVEIMNAVTGGRIEWGIVFREIDKRRVKLSPRKATDDRDMAVKIGMIAAEAGWGIDSPYVALYCARYAVVNITDIAESNNARYEAIGKNSFTTEDLRVRAMESASSQLKVFDNSDPENPGYLQIITDSYSQLLKDYPVLTADAQRFMRELVSTDDIAKANTSPQPREAMLASLRAENFNQALEGLNQVRKKRPNKGIRFKKAGSI